MHPYVYLGIGAAWIVSLVGVGAWQNGVGHVEERAEWQSKQITELADANTEIARLNAEVRAKEKLFAEKTAQNQAQHQKEIRNVKAQRDRDVAAAYSGSLSLRFTAEGRIEAGRGGAGLTLPGTSGCDAATGSELPAAPVQPVLVSLPDRITAGLFEIVNDADQVVIQLQACQRQIMIDRGEPVL